MFSAEDVNKLQKLSESLDKAEHVDIRVSEVGGSLVYSKHEMWIMGFQSHS